MNAAARRRTPNATTGRWVPAIAAAALLGTVVFVGVAGGSNGTGVQVTDAGGSTLEPIVTTDSVSPTTAPPPTAAPVTVDETPAKVPLGRTLANGVAGDDVRRVQERLVELGFNPGPVDGIYGSLTIQSVWAFEKLVMGTEPRAATGRVTPEMWDRMQDPIRIEPRRTNPGTPNHMEVYLEKQVVAIFHQGRAVFVSHISSGTGEEWCQEVTISPGEFGNENGEEPLKVGRCGRSVTPGGIFTVHRKVEGHRQSALGGMLNPVYFNYGIAIHGAYNVPLQPASKGCIRIANDLSDDMFELLGRGDRVFVWDGVKEPEAYGEQLPVFDWPDPDYTTTTTSTTTTTTSTTSTTTTTVPPTTTTTAAPTTTTSTTTTSSSSTTTTTEPD